MEEITPYETINEAFQSLDNGGRFYDIFSKAEDGVITKAELSRVCGLISGPQKTMLFLDLSISKLDSDSQKSIISKLDNNLQATYDRYRPQYLVPSEANTKGIVSSNAVITGIPQLTDSKSDFLGFIMVPIMTGKVMTFSMIPLIDTYDVYHIKDEVSSDSFIIAHNKGAGKLPEKKIKVAGILKELKSDKEEKNASKIFLEAFYHLTLD